jgi:hypothetical protein
MADRRHPVDDMGGRATTWERVRCSYACRLAGLSALEAHYEGLGAVAQLRSSEPLGAFFLVCVNPAHVKKRGSQATGKDPLLNFRATAELDRRLARRRGRAAAFASEAIRRLIERGLAKK